MARYVDVEKLIVEYDRVHIGAAGGARKLMEEAPTADVQEVKHGEWKINTDEYDCEYMMCSVCKEEFYPGDADTVDTTPNYCPNCGAKMERSDKDE